MSETANASGARSNERRNFFDRFYEGGPSKEEEKEEASGEKDALVAYIAASVVGADDAVTSPFGRSRRLVYADYTASGRALSFVEDYIRGEVLPLYGNTHTSTSATGLQSTLFREDARKIVHRSVHASKDDVVIFVGSGSTAAVNLLARLLRPRAAAAPACTVVVGPAEHHSNLLPWRELAAATPGARVVEVRPADAAAAPGGLDLAHLEELLREASAVPGALVIGSFSAASNVTGLGPPPAQVEEVTAMLHAAGGLALWDYAASGPYVRVDMNPRMQEAAPARYAKDAVFMSPHKMVGGVGTPGVLVVKKALLTNEVPPNPGGGTVFFVTSRSHTYLQNFEEREEGGTPDVVGAVRCGLAFQLKEAVGVPEIERRERAFVSRALAAFRTHPSLVVLGDVPGVADPKGRLAIVSLMFAAPPAAAAAGAGAGAAEGAPLFLHYNFVCALLNDLFGVQARGGCACAGPYAQRLLGIRPGASDRFEAALASKVELVRPGFVRLNFNYFVPEAEFRFLLDAVLFVAEHGWKLLPLYGYHADTGEWRHRQRMTRHVGRRWLDSVSYAGGAMRYQTMRERAPAAAFDDTMREAHEAVARAEAGAAALAGSAGSAGAAEAADLGSEKVRGLRWFMLPSEARALLASGGAAAGASAGRAPWPEAVPRTEAASMDPRRYGDVEAAAAESEGPDAAAVAAVAFPAVAGAPRAAEPDRRAPVCKNCFHRHSPAEPDGVGGGDGGGGGGATGVDGFRAGECLSCACNSYVPDVPAPAAAPAPAAPAASHGAAAGGMTKKQQLKRLEKRLLKHVGAAIRDFDMIREGDRVVVALSGGKDSLTLLHALLLLQRRSPVKFEVAAATVDPQTPEYDPSTLKGYLKSLGVPYFYESQPVLEQAKVCMLGARNVSICSFCARMKRGMLYAALRREGYNVLAMGQHLDDLAESFLMSAFHNGLMRTMKANYHVEAGDIRVIRPLIYAREHLCREYANVTALPIITENCPACFEQPKERARMKSMLAAQEQVHPALFSCMLKAMMPLIGAENTAYESRQQVAAGGSALEEEEA